MVLNNTLSNIMEAEVSYDMHTTDALGNDAIIVCRHPFSVPFMELCDNSITCMLYNCNSVGSKLTTSQKRVINPSKERATDFDMSASLWDSFKKVISYCESNGDMITYNGKSYTTDYLRFCFMKLKQQSDKYKVPYGFGIHKVVNYNKNRDHLTDSQLLGAAMYQLYCSNTSSATTLSPANRSHNSLLYRRLDTEFPDWDSWVAFLQSRSGYALWESQVLSRTGSKSVKFVCHKNWNGDYPISTARFEIK